MREFLVVYSERNREFSIVFREYSDLSSIYREHSGPYNDADVAVEIAEALTAKEGNES